MTFWGDYDLFPFSPTPTYHLSAFKQPLLCSIMKWTSAGLFLTHVGRQGTWGVLPITQNLVLQPGTLAKFTAPHLMCLWPLSWGDLKISYIWGSMFNVLHQSSPSEFWLSGLPQNISPLTFFVIFFRAILDSCKSGEDREWERQRKISVISRVLEWCRGEGQYVLNLFVIYIFSFFTLMLKIC